MNKKIIFDFDGTLLDVRERYYAVFCESCAVIGVPPLSKAVYLGLKERGKKDSQILEEEYNLSPDIVNRFKKHRYSILEESRYLDMDVLHTPVPALLKDLQDKKYELILLSLRDNISASLAQLKKLGITDFFSTIVFTGPVVPGQSHALRKYQRLMEYFSPEELEGNYYVGDTMIDIETSSQLGTKMIFVDWGLDSVEKADTSKISFMAEDVTELRKILLK
mgnify:CR=1 FL=1